MYCILCLKSGGCKVGKKKNSTIIIQYYHVPNSNTQDADTVLYIPQQEKLILSMSLATINVLSNL